MATLKDIGVAAGINILSAFIFFVAFAILRLQPLNDRVYFPKWYLKGLRTDPVHGGAFVRKVVNLDWRSYIRFLNWMPAALRMPEPELIDHAGLDSVVYVRIYLMRLNIFVPIAFLAWAILVPVNWTSTGQEIAGVKNITSSDIDKLSISNVQRGSDRFWSHIVAAYAFTFWTCYILMKEYGKITVMRLQFFAAAAAATNSSVSFTHAASPSLKWFPPTAATVSLSLILGISGLPDTIYRNAVEMALADSKCYGLEIPNARLSCFATQGFGECWQ